MKIRLYCDESGAKGYSDQEEKVPGEVGVMAGVMVPDGIHDRAKLRLDAIAKSYAQSSGKLHITDLDPNAGIALRREVFEAIADLKLPLFWYAVHVEGFRAMAIKTNSLTKAAAESHRSSSRSGVKFGSFREHHESLHSALMEGLVGNVITFLMERGQVDVELVVCSDHVDSGVEEVLKDSIEELVEGGDLSENVTAWDPAKKEVVKGKVEIRVDGAPFEGMRRAVKRVEIELVDDSHGLSVAADVLANSLNRHFLSRSDAERYGPLNSRLAVESHPLFACLDSIYSWSEELIGDGLYAHPEWKKRAPSA